MSSNRYQNPSSGISYTNKDFNSIYSEELDTVKELTKKWDPTISNESDPGVVLLKENAIIADKENYNIDKNVLEVFPLSVSQYGNARQLYDSLGYEMGWYRSATTEVSYLPNITYSYTGSEDLTQNPIAVPMFTMVADSTGEYVYTLINPPVMDGSKKSYSSSAIQGVIDSLVIGGSETITLSNLDADLRVYLPETMVAENGIFICNEEKKNWSDWKRVSNIEGSLQTVRTIYSFGVLPNSNTCYIQFAQDIADVIGSGLNIKYIKSLGESGNIPANTIESFYSDNLYYSDESKVSAEDLLVTNLYSIDNGQDPEDLRSAYRNYKKTVGTFNTLVTCRDYENAIFNRVSYETGQPIASNAVVSDRTNDINYSHSVITLSETGNEKELAVSQSDGEADMTAFDLGLYILEPMASTYSATNYAKSFSVNSQYSYIKNEIASEKSAQHDYIDTETSKPFMVKNFYDLDGKVVTYYKVTEEDARDIENKIRTNLYEKFNARQVDIGSPVDYDYLIETIKESDSRIKSVILNEPTYVPYIMDGEDKEGTSTSAHVKAISPRDDSPTVNESKNILANLIANGNVQLYKFDPDFQLSFGNATSNPVNITGIYKNIKSITTTASIAVPTSDPGNPNVGENERVIITCPSLVAKTSYTYYTQYKYSGGTMTAKEVHTLLANEQLDLKWVSDGTEYSISYGEGDIVKPSIKVEDTSGAYEYLGQTESIDIMEINTTTFSGDTAGSNLLCYWAVTNRDNILFGINDTERILSENEYFLYTDEQHSGVVVLGSGTKLSRSHAGKQVKVEKVEITSSNLEDKVKTLDWYTGFDDLTITEQDMIVLGSGSTVWVDSALSRDLNNVYLPVDVNTTISYKASGSTSEVQLKADSTNLQYSIRSRLDISSTPSSPQILSSADEVDITMSDDTVSPSITSCNLSFNYALSMEGGENVDVSTIDSAGNVDYKLSAMSYEGEISPVEDGYIEITTNSTISVTKDSSVSVFGNAVIPIIITGFVSSVSITSNGVQVSNLREGANFIKCSWSSDTIEISVTFDGLSPATVLVGKISPYDGYYLHDYLSNEGVSNPTGYMDGVVDIIDTFAQYNSDAVYDVSYRVSEDSRLDEPFSAESFWDVDNPYNRYTIPQMRECNISVIKSSKL